MKYKSSRPKGYAPWNPRNETLTVLQQVQDVLDQYRQHWPLTIRQIFYRLVGTCGFEKTEKGYSRLCEYIARARRATMIPFDAIRDDGTTKVEPDGFYNLESFYYTVKLAALNYQRNKSVRQPRRILILVEAAGMVPQIVRVVGKYGVPVLSSSGFDSLTMKHELAQDILNEDRPSVILHIGDYDPSGVCIFDSIKSDVEAFVDGKKCVFFLRIALTEEQIDEHELPTAPAKKTDRRGNGVEDTCQCEALPPDILAEIVHDELMRYYALSVFEEDILAEQSERELLVEKMERL